jgi:hypothetical protein
MKRDPRPGHSLITVVAAFAASCARMEPPPADHRHRAAAARHDPPDPLASIPNFKGDVEFQFDEDLRGWLAQSGAGTGDLEKLVIPT